MTKMADFYRDSVNLYYQCKNQMPDGDWEQAYFDAMELRYDTEEEVCLVHIYYSDDDYIGEVAQGILDDLNGRRLILSNCFEDGNAVIVATIVDKK